MNLFLFKIYIIRGYSPFWVPYERLMPQRQEKAPLFSLSVPRYRQWAGGGGEESKGTKMEMKSSLVKVKTKTN